MTAQHLADQYFATWNEPDADRRTELIAATWTETSTFVDPSFETHGHDELNKLMGAAQKMFPGLSFVRVGEIDDHHNYRRWTWHLKADGQEPVAGGTDIVRVDAEGRITHLIGFHDFAPEHPSAS